MLAMEDWPPFALFSDAILKMGLPTLRLRYPWLIVRLHGCHAIYKVDTCEHGMWTGALMESTLPDPVIS